MFSKVKENNELPFVSVIVPTLNRKKSLENCLNSLFKLDYPKSKFEVLVVNNNSVDGTDKMVCREFPKVKVVLERSKGASYARNAGWRHAKGLIIAYTDDDCVVDPSWLRSLVSGFTSAEIGGTGGPVLHLHPELIPEKFHGPPFGPFYLGDIKRLVKALVTGNLAVRKEAFEKIIFDGSLFPAEDIDFSRSMIQAGYKLSYIPDAKVYHDIDHKRVTMPYLLKRALLAGISLYIVERKWSTKRGLVARFLRSSLGALIVFFQTRRVTNFFWLVKCFVAFVSSMVFINL